MSETLSEKHHHLWILTILATVCGTDAQRRAFSDGYNKYPLTPGASLQMRKNHELGAEVHDILNPTPKEDNPDGN